MIQYTSGTTGDPKAAMLSHRGIVNNARFSAARFELKPHSTWYCAVPMFHTAGCVYASLGALWNHGAVLMASSFDPARMIDAIENDAVSWSNLVPTMVLRLLEERRKRPHADLSSLKIVVCGGSVVSPELIRRVESELGCDFVMVFGQTELCGAATQSYRHDTDHHRSRTIGIPLTHVEAKVIDTATGATVAIGQQGELCVRGYLTLLEYFDQPDATTTTLDREGWVHTGDIGTMEADGYLTLTGRLKDVINRGGEKIFPREIEDALAEHPAVADSAVFSIPHPQWGEVGVAAVRPAENCVETEDSIKQWLRERIARHKVPQHIYFCSSFPLTPSGKTQKFVLREQYLSQHLEATSSTN
jgi:fatty-acyl-CoA synthase